MAENPELNLIQKLAKIRAISDVAKKDKRGYNYTYTDITSILANVTAGMKKYGVSLIPSIVPGTASIEKNVIQNIKYSKSGDKLETVTTEMLFRAEMVFTWFNDDNPDEKIGVPWYATASMSDASQSLGAAMTYTMRQFLTTYFQIAQSDNDVDAYRSKQKEAEEAENKAIADSITDQIVSLVSAHLENHAEDRDKILAVIKKYAKDKGKASPNPKLIHDPEAASKLLAELKETFGIGANA